MKNPNVKNRFTRDCNWNLGFTFWFFVIIHYFSVIFCYKLESLRLSTQLRVKWKFRELHISPNKIENIFLPGENFVKSSWYLRIFWLFWMEKILCTLCTWNFFAQNRQNAGKFHKDFTNFSPGKNCSQLYMGSYESYLFTNLHFTLCTRLKKLKKLAWYQLNCELSSFG